jgi:hypothetical protein
MSIRDEESRPCAQAQVEVSLNVIKVRECHLAVQNKLLRPLCRQKYADLVYHLLCRKVGQQQVAGNIMISVRLFVIDEWSPAGAVFGGFGQFQRLQCHANHAAASAAHN